MLRYTPEQLVRLSKALAAEDFTPAEVDEMIKSPNLTYFLQVIRKRAKIVPIKPFLFGPGQRAKVRPKI